MNTVDLSINVRNTKELITLVLYQKIYSTPNGIVKHWSTDTNSEYRLEIIIDEDDLSVNPLKITKSMSITTEEWLIADQMMLKLFEKGSFQLQNQASKINNNKIY
ncbi:MAG: hypothetical protein C0597_08210 [Marinilabiliales bacterium]|nr:MAG: hypothetical protein C0597_08210 [Marinilabiliales bacterium]